MNTNGEPKQPQPSPALDHLNSIRRIVQKLPHTVEAMTGAEEALNEYNQRVEDICCGADDQATRIVLYKKAQDVLVAKLRAIITKN